ncbi:MAG: hypothetical protein ACLT98_02550 [Eggerthellaceae bacterium]
MFDLERGFDAQAAAVSGREAVRCPACGAPMRAVAQRQAVAVLVVEVGRQGGGAGSCSGLRREAQHRPERQEAHQVAGQVDPVGKTVHLTGLSKKDGSGTFDTDAKLGAAPYTGSSSSAERKPGGSAGRTASRRRGGKR